MGPQGADRTVHAEYDWSEDDPSVAVIETVAAAEDVTPVELASVRGHTLYEFVDPEALDALVASDIEVGVTFSYGEYTVRIDGSEVTVSPEA